MKEEDGCMEMENIPETKRNICMIGIVVGSNNCSPFKLSNFFRLCYIGTDINEEESPYCEKKVKSDWDITNVSRSRDGWRCNPVKGHQHHLITPSCLRDVKYVLCTVRAFIWVPTRVLLGKMKFWCMCCMGVYAGCDVIVYMNFFKNVWIIKVWCKNT